MPLSEQNPKSLSDVFGWRLLRYQQKLAGVPSAPFASIVLGVVGTIQAPSVAILGPFKISQVLIAPISHMTAC